MSYHRNISFDPKQDFAARIARIEAGGINTNRTLFVGNEEALALPPGIFVRRPKRKPRALALFLTLVVGSTVMIVATMASANLY
jgi:hypothetical protein